MPEGAAGRPQRTLEEILAEKEPRASGNLAVRDVKKEGKDLAGHTSPPDSGPHPRESKAGNLPRERPAIGQSQDGGSEGFGSQFQEMKKSVTRLEGESRKAYKKRVHASMRSVKKGGKPLTSSPARAAVAPKPRPQPKKRDVPETAGVEEEHTTPAAKAKSGRKTDTRRVMLRMEPARGPGGFAKKVALKSREKAEAQRRARLWASLDEDDGVPEMEPDAYPW